LEKRGCATALGAAGITTGDHLAWAAEMRVGLVGVVRRVWAPVGVKVRQQVQQVREWRYLVMAIKVLAGRLWWCWTDAMQREEIAGVVPGWQQNTNLEAVVWDGASSQRSHVVQEVGFPLVQQPGYAPELNPAERLFKELRRVVEGKVYHTIDATVAAIEAELQDWDADPDRVRRLVSWPWIMDTLNQLPGTGTSAA
jgi:DDE superfamily endonuclease